MAGTPKDSVTLKAVMMGSGYSIPEGKGDQSFNALIEGGTVATPTAEIADNKVVLACATEGATILYTTDGSTPGYGSSVYSEPLNVSAGATVKAIGVKSGDVNSEVLSFPVTKVATPSITIASHSATITCATEGAAIKYKINSGEWTDYTAAVTTEANDVVTAVATKAGMLDSEEATATDE